MGARLGNGKVVATSVAYMKRHPLVEHCLTALGTFEKTMKRQ